MSWNLKKRQKERLDAEEGAVIKDWGGKTSVALVYPNTYQIGMSNLAIHVLYRLFNSRTDVVCERAFLPDKEDMKEHLRTDTPLMSIESQRSLAEFDIVMFSISFENDYLNILPILDLARIPHRRRERGEEMPPLVVGGAAPTLNPLPVSEIFDAVVLGEAEGFADDLVPLIASRLSKRGLLAEMDLIDGIFIPSSGQGPEKDRSQVSGPKRRAISNLDDWPTQTVIYSADAWFGDMHLIEVQRGCPFGCSFCATPALYHPPRQRSLDAIVRMVEEGLPHRRRMGLIGAHILSHPGFSEIAQAIHSRGATFSLSSVRADDVDKERASLLATSGLRTVALGVEAGSERLRSTVGKGLSNNRIIDAASTLARAGITHIKLYFMIGLPGETDNDIAAIAELSARVRGAAASAAPRGKGVAIDLTIAPFVPKPGTPFASERFAGESILRKKIGKLRRLIAGGHDIHCDPVGVAATEAYLSRAGAEAIEFLEEARRAR